MPVKERRHGTMSTSRRTICARQSPRSTPFSTSSRSTRKRTCDTLAIRSLSSPGQLDRENRLFSTPAAGGAEGNRTPDLCSAIAALSHLSYSPAPPAGRRRPMGSGRWGAAPLAACFPPCNRLSREAFAPPISGRLRARPTGTAAPPVRFPLRILSRPSAGLFSRWRRNMAYDRYDTRRALAMVRRSRSATARRGDRERTAAAATTAASSSARATKSPPGSATTMPSGAGAATDRAMSATSHGRDRDRDYDRGYGRDFDRDRLRRRPTDRDLNYDRGVFNRGGSSERDYNRGWRANCGGSRDRDDDRPRLSADDRRLWPRRHESDQFFAASGYGRGERGWATTTASQSAVRPRRISPHQLRRIADGPTTATSTRIIAAGASAT